MLRGLATSRELLVRRFFSAREITQACISDMPSTSASFHGAGQRARAYRQGDADAKHVITVAGSYRRAKAVAMNPIADDADRQVASVSADVFFFQAEDGIRDLTVTGVQTCALPI